MAYQPKTNIPCVTCGAPSVGRKLCRRHYYEAQRRGSLSQYPLIGPADVFWERATKTDGCWVWSGTRNSYGYGVFLLPGERPVRAHRHAYELTHGPIPDGLVVMHSCDNPPCINPTHLSLGGRGDNNRDAKAKGRNAAGEANGHAKLTAAQVADIRRDARTQRAIAAQYGVDESTISQIRAGKRWKSTL